MTIGPEPITSTRLMSVRLGTFFHFVEELPEEVIRVVRAWCRFRVVLHAEHRLRLVAQALDGAVIEIDVRLLDAWRQRLAIDGEAVILRSDLHASGFQFLDRMIRTAVAELQLVG